MEAVNGSFHSNDKGLEMSLRTNFKGTGINNGIKIENKFVDKTSESKNQGNLAKLKAESTENTDDEESVGSDSPRNFAFSDVDNIDEKLAGKSSSSNPINKDITNIKSEKSFDSNPCSNLLVVSNTVGKSENKSLESSYPDSHANIENKSKGQTNESSSLSTPIEFKQMSNTESTGVETSDKSRSALLGGGAAISVISLQDDVLKGCSYDPSTADNRKISEPIEDLLENLNELLEVALQPPAAAEAVVVEPAAAELPTASEQPAVGEACLGSDSDPSQILGSSLAAVQQFGAEQAILFCCSEDDPCCRAVTFFSVWLSLICVASFIIAFHYESYLYVPISAVLGVFCLVVVCINCRQRCRRMCPAV